MKLWRNRKFWSLQQPRSVSNKQSEFDISNDQVQMFWGFWMFGPVWMWGQMDQMGQLLKSVRLQSCLQQNALWGRAFENGRGCFSVAKCIVIFIFIYWNHFESIVNVDNMVAVAIYIMLQIVGMLMHAHLHMHMEVGWMRCKWGSSRCVSAHFMVISNGKANLWDWCCSDLQGYQ